MDASLVEAHGGVSEAIPVDLPNDVKMVIWDLDETFWRGTLAEGKIEFVREHGELVKTLAARGIISSIVSKNNHENAKEILEQEGLWNYFVFPSISFEPKGKRIAETIENASLRPQNILFIDDNPANLEEARFFNEGIMVADPAHLSALVSHPSLTGKPDPHLKRLEQYQLLQRRFTERQTTDLSNEDFLRSSGIELFFDFEVNAKFDRVVELINRTNQLNYTKNRLETEAHVEAFRSQLDDYGISAACISCRDRYGDHGVVGFYMLKRWEQPPQFKLLHFLFSCRTMNMGIEQFVYEYLGKPELVVVPEVAHGLDTHQTIDWISVSDNNDEPPSLISKRKKLLLVGGCELLQLASYCSSDRTEFVNSAIRLRGVDHKVRYDDPYFFITKRHVLRKWHAGTELPTWTYDDALLLDKSIAEAEIILLAMRAALRHVFVRHKISNIRVRMEVGDIDLCLKRDSASFHENYEIEDIDLKKRLALIKEAFDKVRKNARPGAAVFIIGASTCKPLMPEWLKESIEYNKALKQFCRETKGCYFVDVDTVLSEDQVVKDQNFSPAGCRALSNYIRSVVDQGRAGSRTGAAVRSGRQGLERH